MLRCVQLVRRAPIAVSRLAVVRSNSSITGGSGEDGTKDPNIHDAASRGDQRAAVAEGQIASQAKKAGINLDAIAYSAMITACAKASQWQLALQLFEEAKKSKDHAQCDYTQRNHHCFCNWRAVGESYAAA
jgi:pentatricopeptide repeat protein